MKWFTGSIPEAIAAAQQRKAIFVVVVTSEDDNSKELLTRLEDPGVLLIFDNFVTVHLKNGTTESQQFAQLYPLVVVPSVYFIGLQGLPLEVVGGVTDTENLKTRAQKALDAHVQQTQPQAQPAVPESAGRDTNAEDIEVAPSAAEGSSSESIEDRVKKAQEKLALIREKKAAEEREKEKLQEVQRRQLGKDLQKFNEEKREREMREIAEQRQREKQEEKLAREKIRQQIAQDRADRAAQYQAAKAEEEERKKAAVLAQQQLQQERAAAAAAARSAFARLQFRLPDGSTRNKQFEADVTLARVVEFVNNEIKPSFKPYSLFTTFPRREFQKSDMSSTLRDLNLAPSAALLIVPSTNTGTSVSSASSGSGSWFSWLLAPLWTLFAFISRFIFAAPPIAPAPADNTAAGTAPQPPGGSSNQGAVRRRYAGDGNVRQLRDNSGDDNSDDNATWNGNSTQQL